ncbi:DNA cytosine methyltransferase [Microvirgula aerodenitrificans]|uniref:DNA cytosine methyltransferase n=1 Tax=Microvirgula aerodenitrificans TaxID=57480 RepID=UPI002F40ED9D
MIRDQFLLGMDNEIIVDLFAGGGGMSTAIEQALGRHVDIAINHDMDAISMHMANHPQTEHYCADVFEVDPREAVKGRAVGHLHGSPDCTHHSQAAGGQPRSKKIRGLGWVLPRWAGQVSPRSISMENVKQMQQWGPLIAKRDKTTGRVLRLDGSVAGPGERVPVQKQYLIPDPRHAGRTWRRFIRAFEQMGYTVEWRILVAADYSAATTRERLFLFARRDGRPIVWPEPTHHRNPTRRQKAWRPAADHLDWSIPCPSIFERKRPLADATMRRIAKGMKKFVLDSADPFIVPIANWSGESVQSAAEPLRTITAYPKGGAFSLCAPTMVKFRGDSIGHAATEPCPTITSGGGSKRPAGAAHALGLATAILVGAGGPVYSGKPQSPGDPIGTLLTENHRALSTAYLMQANGGFNTTPGHDLREPASTITNTSSQQQLIAANLVTLRRNCTGRDANEPLPTLTAGAEHHGLVQYTLSQEHEAGALRCAAFLISYYGNDGMRDPREPMPTATTHDRMALVTVWIQGEPWVVVDIGLRMLTPPELYGCQGFPAGYIIDHGHDGRAFTKSAQVRMVGNSVSPPPATALLRANCADLMAWSRTELRERERIAA